MDPLLRTHLEAIAQTCQRHGVRRLEVFGSAATEAFDPENSDVDFVVEFESSKDSDLFRRYFGLKESLEQVLGRSVDLVMAGAMRNPYFIASVNRTRKPIYVAPVSQTA